MSLSRKIYLLYFNLTYFHDRFGRTCQLKNDTILEDYKIFYIGKESLALTNLMMSYNKNAVILLFVSFLSSLLDFPKSSCKNAKETKHLSFFTR